MLHLIRALIQSTTTTGDGTAVPVLWNKKVIWKRLTNWPRAIELPKKWGTRISGMKKMTFQ